MSEEKYIEMARALFGEKKPAEVKYIGGSQEMKDEYEKSIKGYRELVEQMKTPAERQYHEDLSKALIGKGEAEKRADELQKRLDKITADSDSRIVEIHNKYLKDNGIVDEEAQKLGAFTEHLLRELKGSE